MPEGGGPLAGGDAPAPSPALAPPPGNPRFPLFDGLRGLAALAVLAAHAFEITAQTGVGFQLTLAAGSEGLVVFFVMSGFLLYRPYVAARARNVPMPSTRRYARRRLLRVVPAYWVALTVLAIFPGIVGVFSGHWWRYYGYLQLYWPDSRNTGISVAWTLCVEVPFYFALPFWASAIRRLPRRAGAGNLLTTELVPLAVVFAGGLIVQVASDQHSISYVFGVSVAGQCSWMALGMALAAASVAVQYDEHLLRRLRAVADRPLLCWAMAAAALAGLAALIPPGGVFGLLASIETPQSFASAAGKLALETVLLTSLALPAVFGQMDRGIPRRILALRPIALLGAMAYSFYLYHLTIMELIGLSSAPASFSASGVNLLGHLHSARTLVMFLVTLAATLAVAGISYRLVELPFLRRKER